MRVSLAVLVSLCSLVLAGPPQDRPWMDTGLTPAQRASQLLAQMNFTEKIDMIHGWSGPYIGNVIANTRLGIPALNLNDGPQGFRAPGFEGSTTQWPSAQTISATWDVNAVYAWAQAMASEFAGKGANVQLGPAFNLARAPLNGRSFEYMAGEDPYFGSMIVAAAIKGIQSQGVIANAKHFINNEEEFNRWNISENVDKRSHMEVCCYCYCWCVSDCGNQSKFNAISYRSIDVRVDIRGCC